MSNASVFAIYWTIIGFMIGMTGGATLQLHFDRKQAVSAGVGQYTTHEQTKERIFTYSSEPLQGMINTYEKNN